MATVPVYGERKIQTVGAPNQIQQSHLTADALGGAEGRALAQAGGQIAQAGQQAMQIAQREAEAERVAEVQKRSADAMFKVQEAAYKDTTLPDGTVKKGWLNRVGTEAQGLPDEANQFFDGLNKELEGVQNPEVRRALDQKFTQLRLQYGDTILRHDQKQAEFIRQQASEAAVTAQANQAILNPADPEKLKLSFAEIDRNIAATMHGQDPSAIANAQLKAKSAARAGVIDRLLTDNVPAAKKQFDEWKAEGAFDGPDLIKVEKVVEQKHLAWEVDAAKKHAVSVAGSPAAKLASVITPSLAGGPMPTTQAPALQAAVQKQETGGERNPDTAVSSAGALGRMQIMPDTAKEISQNIVKDGLIPKSWSEAQIADFYAKNPEVNVYHGTMYLDHLLKQYDGDVKTALIAYNGGPGRANEWLAKGRDDSVLPAETRNYAKQIMGRLGEAVGGAPIETRAALDGMPQLPPVEAKYTPDNLPADSYYPPERVFRGRPNAFVNARAFTMANELGKRFEEMTGKRVEMNSGFRDPGTNAAVGGAKGSRHMHGDAFDFDIKGLGEEEKTAFLQLARQVGFSGIGFYEGGPGHLHLDIGNPRTWGEQPAWAKGALAQGFANTPIAGDRSRSFTGNNQLSTTGFTRVPSLGSLNANVPPAVADAFAPNLYTPTEAVRPPEAPVPAAAGVIQPVAASLNVGQTDWAAARASVEEQYANDPPKRDMILAQLRQDQAVEAQERRSMVGKVSTELMRQINQGKRMDELDPAAIALLDEVSPQISTRLQAMIELREKRADRTDYAVYKRLMDLPQEELAATDMTKYGASLSTAHMEKLIDRSAAAQEKLRSGAETSSERVEQTITKQIQFAIKSNPILGTISSTPTKPNPQGEARIGLFDSEVRREISALLGAKAANGEKAPQVTPKEIEDITKRLLTPTGDGKLLYELGSAEENIARVSSGLDPVGGRYSNFPTIGAGETRFKAADTVEEIVNRHGTQVVDGLAQYVASKTKGRQLSPQEAHALVVPLYSDIALASRGMPVVPRGPVGDEIKERAKSRGYSDRQTAEAYSRFLRQTFPIFSGTR